MLSLWRKVRSMGIEIRIKLKATLMAMTWLLWLLRPKKVCDSGHMWLVTHVTEWLNNSKYVTMWLNRNMSNMWLGGNGTDGISQMKLMNWCTIIFRLVSRKMATTLSNDFTQVTYLTFSWPMAKRGYLWCRFSHFIDYYIPTTSMYVLVFIPLWGQISN